MLEKCKKLRKKKIIQGRKNNFFLIFHKKLEEWKKLGKKFRRPGKNCWKNGRSCGRRKYFKVKKIYFLSFSKNFWKNGRS